MRSRSPFLEKGSLVERSDTIFQGILSLGCRRLAAATRDRLLGDLNEHRVDRLGRYVEESQDQ